MQSAVHEHGLDRLARPDTGGSGQRRAFRRGDPSVASSQHLPGMGRLEAAPQVLQTLASGIRAIAAAREPLGAASSRLEVAEGLTL